MLHHPSNYEGARAWACSKAHSRRKPANSLIGNRHGSGVCWALAGCPHSAASVPTRPARTSCGASSMPSCDSTSMMCLQLWRRNPAEGGQVGRCQRWELLAQLARAHLAGCAACGRAARQGKARQPRRVCLSRPPPANAAGPIPPPPLTVVQARAGVLVILERDGVVVVLGAQHHKPAAGWGGGSGVDTPAPGGGQAGRLPVPASSWAKCRGAPGFVDTDITPTARRRSRQRLHGPAGGASLCVFVRHVDQSVQVQLRHAGQQHLVPVLPLLLGQVLREKGGAGA